MQIKKDLRALANPKKAHFLKRYFKTGYGEYAEGDVFLGINVPNTRKVAEKYLNLSLSDLEILIKSKVHEERQVCLMILVGKYKKATSEKEKKSIYTFYLRHRKYINNWDLVDLSAENIIGPYLQDKDKIILTKLANSKSIWDRRIAMLATFHYIKQGKSYDAIKIATILIEDNHDLIQKAGGWMLREIGKRCSEDTEEEFFKKYYKRMPRTMIRYAIERFPEGKRKKFLEK